MLYVHKLIPTADSDIRGDFFTVQEISGTIFQNSTSYGDGASVSLSSSFASFEECNWSNMAVQNNGAAVCVRYHSGASLQSCTITNSFSQTGYGGGIYVGISSNIVLINTTLAKNMAPSGGALALTTESTAHIDKCNIYSNIALIGAGIFTEYSVKLSILDSAIYDNAASVGGGIYCSDTKLNITSCSIMQNNATQNDPNVDCSTSPPGTSCFVTGDTAWVQSCGRDDVGSSTIPTDFPMLAIIGIALGGAALILCAISVAFCVSWRKNLVHQFKKEEMWNKMKKEEDLELLADYDE